MKVSRFMALALIIIAFCAPSFARADEGGEAMCFEIIGRLANESYAHLHDTASLTSPSIGQILPSDTCRVISKHGAFYEIELNGARGFIYYTMLALQVKYVPAQAASGEAFSAKSNIKMSSIILNRYQRLRFTGQISASAPVKLISAYVFDTNKFVIETSGQYAPGSRADRVDASVLGELLDSNSLSCGPKRIYVVASDGASDIVVYDAEFIVLGEAGEQTHITNACGIQVTNGYVDSIVDARLNSQWTPVNADSRITINIPKGRNSALITLTWAAPPESYTVIMEDFAGNTLGEETVTGGLRIDAIALPERTRYVSIGTSDMACALSTLRVYDAECLSPSVQRWTQLPEKVDLMLISAHQDDEFLFFGGAIPAYVQRGKTVAVVYMANCGISRYQEALNGLWAAGLRTHPVFLGYADYLAESLQEAQSLWARNNPLKELAALLRRYRPEVIVTHDYQGEYGHMQHIYTAQLVEQAVKLAADASFNTDSSHDAWQVKKLYIHLYPQNEIIIDWDAPIDKSSAFTPMQLAIIGYDKHVSQHSMFKMETTGVRYDNRRFGLAYTAVGADILKNDFFENIGS